MPENGQRCVAVKADGTRCGTLWSLSEAGLCIAHDPARAELHRLGIERSLETRAAKAERRRVGVEGLPDRQPRTLADAVEWAGAVAHCLARGTVDTKIAAEINKGLSVLVHAIEKKELESELHRVKRELKKLTSGKAR